MELYTQATERCGDRTREQRAYVYDLLRADSLRPEGLNYRLRIKPERPGDYEREIVIKRTDYLRLMRQDCFATAYVVERLYGGPEEGGWWYDHYTILRSVPCKVEHYPKIAEALKKEFEHLQDPKHDRYSVLGTGDVIVCLEESPGENETREKPRWE